MATKNQRKALDFLNAADKETDIPEWEPETVQAWALAGIGFALVELTDAIRALAPPPTLEKIMHDLPTEDVNFPRPQQTQHVGMPPVIADNTIHTPTINQTQRDTEQ